MEKKSNKKWWKKIILIILILLILLIVISNIPTYTKYDLKTDEIEIWLMGDHLIIDDKEEIEIIIKLLNNGKDEYELVIKEYNRGLNRLIEEYETACARGLIITFDTVNIEVCHTCRSGYIYDKDSKKGIKISEEAIEYIKDYINKNEVINKNIEVQEPIPALVF